MVCSMSIISKAFLLPNLTDSHSKAPPPTDYHYFPVVTATFELCGGAYACAYAYATLKLAV